MTQTQDTALAATYHHLLSRIRAQGVEGWLRDLSGGPSRESLEYLCKFAYFTGILTKAEIGAMLDISRPQLKALVKSWYDDHRQKGCGTC